MFRSFISLLAVALLAAPASAQTLSEAEVVRTAADNSPALRAALADARAASAAVDAAERATVPAFILGGNGGYGESLGATAMGVTFNPAATGALTTGLRATTAWGTTFELSVGGTVSYRETNRDPSTTQSVILGPYYGVETALTVRQPILAGNESYDASVRSARASRDAATHQRDAAASSLARSAALAYWELWYADRALVVQQHSLTPATQQHANAELASQTLGSMAPSEVIRFASELAAIEEAVGEAETARQLAAIELARVLAVAPEAVLSRSLDPSPPSAIDAPSANQFARSVRLRSSELLALGEGLVSAQQRVRAAADAAQPQLDVFVRVGASSLYSADMADPFVRPAFSATGGIELALPLGSSARDAQHTQAIAQLDAVEARYEARIQELEAEARTLVTRLESASRRSALARRTADLSTQLAEAERARLTLGSATPSELLSAQQSARAAELRYVRTLVDYAAASLAVEDLSGVLAARFASRIAPNS